MHISGNAQISDSNNFFDTISYAKDLLVEKISVFAKAVFFAISDFFAWAHSKIFSSSVTIDKTLSKSIDQKVSIDSNKWVPIDSKFKSRKDFLNPKNNYKSDPPYIFKSHFIPDALAEGLMRQKSDSAIGVKYLKGSAITNMEALLHSFVVPMCKIKSFGDYHYTGMHTTVRPGGDVVKEMIMSATIHPDFEYKDVMMKLAKLESNEMLGVSMDYTSFPSKKEKKDDSFRAEYDEKLLKHAIYHLTTNHKRVAISKSECFTEHSDAIDYIEGELKSDSFDSKNLANKSLRITEGNQGKFFLSLDILFHFYKEQLKNEFEFLDQHLENKYVYTLGPPSIFASALVGDENVASPAHSKAVAILLRLQALAFKDLLNSREGFASNMAAMGISDFADSSIVSLYKDLLSEKDVNVDSAKKILNNTVHKFNDLGSYKTILDSDGNPTTFVDHNCFDGFGQNIETEGDYGSKDGTYGVNTDAAHVLRRDREDLLSHLIETN